MAINYSHIGDHAPIIPPIPCDQEEQTHRRRKLRIHHLTPEDWSIRDEALTEVLRRKVSIEALRTSSPNATHQYHQITSAIHEVFAEEYRMAERPPAKEPMEQFLLRRIKHHEMEHLLTTIETGGDYHVKRLMRRISSDGWRQFL